MKSNALLPEVRDIKDRLAAEAGYAVHRFVEQLRQLIAEKERRRAEQSALTLNEDSPKPDKP